MEQQQRKLYPIGMQTFSKIRKGNYLYVDKTEYVYRMTHSDSSYIFLNRPRRFGKSLLASTLHSYFEGEKELFAGLAIDKLEKEWTEYPVLHFDMSTAKHAGREQLVLELEHKLLEYEEIYGRGEGEIEINQRLHGLIKRACDKTGRQVVVLIDEYDAPLLDVMHEDENLLQLRNVMRNFYSPLKACDPYLRFVFLTGITKFSQLSIFSELNNIKNISMDESYAAICGISEDELETQMRKDVELFAEKQQMTYEDALSGLKEYYDGYHFAWPSSDIYNPFSLLNALADGKQDFYWFGSGTPAYLIEMLRKFNVIPQNIGSRQCISADFDAPTERMTDITPLLYQSGYITIKDYSPLTELYTLDIPNKEIRIGLLRSLLSNYLNSSIGEGNAVVAKMYSALYHDDIEKALGLLKTFLSTIPYCDNTDYEGHYQQMLFVIFSLLGYYVDVEVRTPRGRVDIVLRTATRIYLVELKMDKSADAAMNQIDLKEYPERFALCGLPVVKVGVNFSKERHTLEGWKIEG